VLLPLLTSLLLPAFAYPTTTFDSLDVDDQHAMRVEIAFAHRSAGVPTPIRLHGLAVDRDVVVCDNDDCLQPRTVRVPANGVVDVDAPTTANGVALGTLIKNRVRRGCCTRPQEDTVAAVVSDEPGLPVAPTERTGEVVRITPVGRLFDEHPALLEAVPLVLLVDGDRNHDAAFFDALQRFVRNGGIVSVDAAQATRLGAHPIALVRHSELREQTVADSAGSVTVLSTRSLTGTVHALDGNGFVIVRPDGQSLRDATADLAFVQGVTLHRWNDTHLWAQDSTVSRAIVHRLQPPVGTGEAALWMVAFGALAGGVAAVQLSRRRDASPVQAALAVLVVAVAVVGVGAVVSALTATTRRTEVVIHGPGARMHDETTVRAAVNDVDTPLTTIVFDAPTAYVTTPQRGRARFGAATAAVGVWHNVEATAGWLEAHSDGSCTNHFKHDVMLVGAAGGMLMRPGETKEVTWSTQNVPLAENVSHIADALREFDGAVAFFVDGAGISHFVVGTRG
jgi:hypothetical protein